MNKKGLVLIACLIVVISLATSAYFTNKDNTGDSEPSSFYVLRVKDDHIAAYKNEKEIESFPSVNYYSLPEYDRNQLKKGITFETMEEIYQIVEDFDG